MKADLLASLRLDLSDPDGALFTDEALTRCLEKGVYRLARDLDTRLSVVDGKIEPEPEGVTREMLLLLAQIHACQLMRAKTANAFAFSSGDKRVDKTKQPEHWAKLEQDLEILYKQHLSRVRPGVASSPEDTIVSPNLKPVIYEQGGDL